MSVDAIFETHDGSHSIQSEKYGVSYHSKYGAIQETNHVFLQHGLMPTAVSKTGVISILEFGFGSGLNAFMTYLWLKQNHRTAYYETIEAYPISLNQAEQLNFPGQLNAADEQNAFLAMHASSSGERLELAEHFSFRKNIELFEHAAYENQFDLVYFDAFAPSAQPELWDESILGKVYQALMPGGRMTTYCAKGSVKRTLKSLGFKVSSPPGPPGKREMTIAQKV